MAFKPDGMAEKLGNWHEDCWVAKQLLRLLNEDIKSITVMTLINLFVAKAVNLRPYNQFCYYSIFCLLYYFNHIVCNDFWSQIGFFIFSWNKF